MPDFKFSLSSVGTSSFYFLDMHGAHLTKNEHIQDIAIKNNVFDSASFLVSILKIFNPTIETRKSCPIRRSF